MGINKFKGRTLIIEESKFITTLFNNTHFICGLCNLIFKNDCAVIFHPINKIGPIFGNHHFCEECALKLTDNPDKVIFEYKLGLL